MRSDHFFLLLMFNLIAFCSQMMMMMLARECRRVEDELSSPSSTDSFLAHFEFPACRASHSWNVEQNLPTLQLCKCAIVNKMCLLSMHLIYSKFTLVGIVGHRVIRIALQLKSRIAHNCILYWKLFKCAVHCKVSGTSDLICIGSPRWPDKSNYFLPTTQEPGTSLSKMASKCLKWLLSQQRSRVYYAQRTC